MAKYTKEELVSFVINSQELDNEAKSQLIKMLRENRSYGIVWEDNPEDALLYLKDNLAYFSEQNKTLISNNKTAPNHILLEGDNIHVLSSLVYTHEHSFDVIYIDPPYNTGAKDWKYNNNYIDSNDNYRHSKWLSLMANRLRLAKKLLKPENSALIVAIDDYEYLHLGCLLEQMFPNAIMQMITSVICPGGKGKKKGTDFTRTHEYIYFLRFGESVVYPEVRVEEKIPLPWRGLIRGTLANGRGKHGVGACGPNQFYPIYVDNATQQIVKIGTPIMEGVDRFSVPQIDGCTAVFPVRPDGTEMNWGCVPEEAESKLRNGYLRVSGYHPDKPQQYGIQYLTKGTIKDIEEGKAIVEGKDKDGSVFGYYPEGKPMLPTTVWNIATHNATQHGTEMLKKVFGEQRFDYPKSLYAVKDCLRHVVLGNKNALILDFFAGSGTTLHATMLLNKEDGGSRRCVLVTNNENNICEEVTYERNRRVIEGYTTPKGEVVEGLSNNSLRYFKTNFFSRELDHQSKKQLFYALADTVRIKENCYTEQDKFGSLNLQGKEKLIRYFEENERKVLMVYDSRVIPYIVREIGAMDLQGIIKVYIFCDGSYPYSEDFKEVISKVDLVPMPGAMLQALRYILPQQDDVELDGLELTEAEINNELKAAEAVENSELQ